MIYKTTMPTDIPEGVWDEKSCVRRQSGFMVDETNLPTSMKWLPKGAPLAYLGNGKVTVCKTAKAYDAASKSATSLKVFKGHLFNVGDKVAESTISAINTSNASYDELTVTALGAAVKANDVLDDGNASKVIGLNYATRKLDGMQSCTPTLQAYEIEEDTLPYPVNDAIKTALTCRHAFKI